MTRSAAIAKLETLRSQGVECCLKTKSSGIVVNGKTVGVVVYYVYVPYSI